jgi:hypothetical protein
MKQRLLFALLLLASFSLSAQSLLDTVRIKMTGMDAGTAISTDDAEQLNDAIDKLFDDDLDMGWEGDEFNIVTTGLVFRNVNVPQGATIDSAFLEIYAHENEGDTAIITIFGEAADSALTYNSTDLITARPSTQDSVRWVVGEDWTIWQPYRTPDLKSIIQEIVNRSGWKAGNALNLIFTGEDQGASNEDNARDFEAFENIEDPDDGGDGLNHPERVPKLFIYYRTGSASIRGELEQAAFSVYPQPARAGAFTLAFERALGGKLDIRLLNLQGQELQQWSRSAAPRMELKAEGIQPGLYLLQINSVEGSATRKLIVE